MADAGSNACTIETGRYCDASPGNVRSVVFAIDVRALTSSASAQSDGVQRLR